MSQLCAGQANDATSLVAVVKQVDCMVIRERGPLVQVITLVATDKQEIYVAKNKAGTMTRLIQEYPLAKVRPLITCGGVGGVRGVN